jgi:peptidyl-prolyl cis-trans isomerase SurA
VSGALTNSLFKTTAFAAFGVACLGSAALAQQSPGDREGLPESYQGPASAVAAIVNDTVITTYDVQQRIRLMVMSSGGRVAPQMLPQLQQQAVRDLVEDQLKLQEAKKFDLVIGEDEILSEIRQMAAQSGNTPEKLLDILKADGISRQTLENEISSSLAWPRLVQGRYGKRARVTEEEIDSTLERMREDATQEQVLVSEICIPVPSPDQAQAYYDGSLQLIEQMRKGVPFAVVAQQFSACTTAAAGGDMGWVRPAELPANLGEAIRNLEPGSVTNPIPSEGAFMILAVRDKRAAVRQGAKSWTFAYASTPVSTGRAAARTALEKLATAEACAGGRTLRQDLGPAVSVAMVENVSLKDVDERFQSAVESLDRGKLSELIEADGELHVLYGCEIDEGLGIPSRSAIEDRIYGRQLERISQQYLRDVERKSSVDIRLNSEPRRRVESQANG